MNCSGYELSQGMNCLGMNCLEMNCPGRNCLGMNCTVIQFMQSNPHEGNDNYKVLKHRKYRITWLSWIEWNPESKIEATSCRIFARSIDTTQSWCKAVVIDYQLNVYVITTLRTNVLLLNVCSIIQFFNRHRPSFVKFCVYCLMAIRSCRWPEPYINYSLGHNRLPNFVYYKDII